MSIDTSNFNGNPIGLRGDLTPEYIDHAAIIEHIAKYMHPNLYVEYGVRGAQTITRVAPYCKQVIGVDTSPTDLGHIENGSFYQMSTREFKDSCLDVLECTIDLAFIDADHHFEVVSMDFEELFPHMSENGVVILHDTFPVIEEWQGAHYAQTCWKMPAWLKKTYQNIDIFTYPIQPGVTLVRKNAEDPAWRKFE